MKKRNVVKNNRDFNRIIELKNVVKNSYFVIYFEKTDQNEAHFGISVGKKIGNAVVRNKLKRQIRNIIDKNKKYYSNGADYIIMVRKSCLNISFLEKENYLIALLNKTTKEKEKL